MNGYDVVPDLLMKRVRTERRSSFDRKAPPCRQLREELVGFEFLICREGRDQRCQPIPDHGDCCSRRSTRMSLDEGSHSTSRGQSSSQSNQWKLSAASAHENGPDTRPSSTRPDDPRDIGSIPSRQRPGLVDHSLGSIRSR